MTRHRYSSYPITDDWMEWNNPKTMIKPVKNDIDAHKSPADVLVMKISINNGF